MDQIFKDQWLKRTLLLDNVSKRWNDQRSCSLSDNLSTVHSPGGIATTVIMARNTPSSLYPPMNLVGYAADTDGSFYAAWRHRNTNPPRHLLVKILLLVLPLLSLWYLNLPALFYRVVDWVFRLPQRLSFLPLGPAPWGWWHFSR